MCRSLLVNLLSRLLLLLLLFFFLLFLLLILILGSLLRAFAPLPAVLLVAFVLLGLALFGLLYPQ